MTTLLVLHSGLIGAKHDNKIGIVGSYVEDYYKEATLRTVKKLQKKGHDSFSVPNRCIRVLTENNIKAHVHKQEDIKDYLQVFNYLDQVKTKTKEKTR